MPHRPNPIPRYNGSNLPPQSQLHPNTTDVVTGSRREKDGLPPRHRASSGASEPSSTPTPPSGSSNPNVGTTPGGRPSGRALPPPRFQRKQRPPRVQQAIAAAANASSSSNATTNTAPNSTQSGGGRRGAANKEGGSLGQRGGAGTGTLTLGPANNWGAGTGAVVSLSMATINAASARASVVHPPQPPPPPPPTIPTFVDDAPRMDRALPLDFLSGMGRGELEGLDPVQLHHRITFGMGRTSTVLRNDLYASEYIHHPNSYSILPPNLSGLEQDMYLLSSAGGTGPGREARDHAATVRARSHSHNHAAHNPVSALYHPINVGQVRGTRTYSPIHPSSPYASSFGHETPPVLQAAAAAAPPPHQHPRVDFDHQLRIRSQSLMAPVDSYRPALEPLSFPSSLSRPTLPPAQHNRPLSFTNALSNPNPPPARYDSTSSMQAQHHLSLNTDLTSDTRLSGSAPQSASGSGSNVNHRKPLKSALKARKSAPDLVDAGRGSPPPMPGPGGGHGGVDVHPQGHPLMRNRESEMLPDPEFTLPDELQAQYAHQLRLLQEEYATKAAKAGKSRQRSVERNKVVPATNVTRGESRRASPGLGRDVEYNAQEVAVSARGRVNRDSTPPSSGGGSAGGYRVAFFEEVKVIDPVESMGAPNAEQDEGGYTSWDDEWTGEGDDDVTEFVYSPSTGVDAGTGAIVERRGIDSERSPGGTESSDFEDDGASDIGDRGHDDTTRSTRPRRDTGESPPTQQRSHDTISPVDSIISPVQAVVHGHEPSPVSSEPIDRYDAHGQAILIAASATADVPSLLPLVEIIAPTPIMISKELEPSEELLKVELPKFDEMDKEDGIIGGVMPMSSTDSTESSDSNRTLKIGLADSTPSSSDTTIAPPAPISPVIEEDSGDEAQALSSLSMQRGSPLLDEVPAASVPQRHTPQQDSVTFPQLRPTLQRLAHRISLGTPPIPPSSHSSFSGMPPLVPGPPPATAPSLEQYHAFRDVASFDSPLHDDGSLRRLSSITSLSSASSGLHGTIPARPPPSFVPNPANPLERDFLYGRTTTCGPNDSVSYQKQHHVHNGMRARPIVPPLVPPQPVRRPPPDRAVPHLQNTRLSRQSALADYSSAASVESGSSHGGGTSGASHVHRARGRSVAGSMLSSSSSGSHHRNLRAPPGPSFGSSNVLPPADSSPGMDSLLSHTSSEQWDRGLLSNARSSESLGAVSATSGRSGGSGGSTGQSAGRALGGESIWTMGKEEEARWPLAPPSSSGHGHLVQSKAQTQYTLRSLVPQVEAAMSSEPASSSLSSKGRVPSLHSGSQHSYELAFLNDPFDGFYNPYSLPPAPGTGRLRLPLQHSRSAPALPGYEADLVQGAYYDPWQRRESKQSSLRNDWQENLRYPEEDVGQFQDGAFSQPTPQVQLRAQAPPFAPASARHSVEQRPPPRASSWSLPIMNPSDPRNTFENRRNLEQDGMIDSASHPLSASSSRPSTARSALYGDPGAEDADQYSARKSMRTLPATGGVFPRYQELATPYAEATMVRPGSSSGRFKSLFKSRDSRVFK